MFVQFSWLNVLAMKSLQFQKGRARVSSGAPLSTLQPPAMLKQSSQASDDFHSKSHGQKIGARKVGGVPAFSGELQVLPALFELQSF